MHTIQLENKKTLYFPEHLGELTNAQYLFFCETLAMYNAGIITWLKFKMQLVYNFLELDHSLRALTPQEKETRNENLYRIALFVDDYFTTKKEEGKTVKILNLPFVDNKIPNFTHNGITYYGPEAALLNISFNEFLEAIGSYNSFQKTQDIQYLNELVAVMYRPKKEATKHNLLTNYDGDIRQEFYQTNVSLRAKAIEGISPGIKLAVKYFFEACINFITTAKDVDVQGNSVDLTVIFKGGTAQEKSIGMLNVLFSLAETNVFGDKEKTGKERYWTILLKLYQNHLDVEKQKKQIKDAKRNKS